MNKNHNILSDDWKRNWQQSIAVRICALVLWAILPIALFVTFYYISNLESTLRSEFTNKADTLAHRLQTRYADALLHPAKANRAEINALIAELGFSYIRVLTRQGELYFGKDDANTQFVTREITLRSPDNAQYQILKIIAYHPVLNKLVNQHRNKILFPVIIGLMLFGLFLIWAIRTTVHKPFEDLVNNTRKVSLGQHDLRFDTSRQDEFGYIAKFFNDMLEKLLEQQSQLKFAVAEAKRANSAKSAFLANMSHELRTPLNAIIGYADLLAEQASDVQQTDSIPDLHKISTAGKYLLDLINNILDITKIEAGKTEVYYELIDAHSMVEEITSTILPLIDTHNNELIVTVADDLGEFKSDYTKLRQSIFNLLSNACKFTRNGKIQLHAFKLTRNSKEKIIFEISDNGAGMSDECLKNLFVPFSRGNHSLTQKIDGTGLGLAISRHFCNLLGGEISVQSAPGVGTVFTIHIPYLQSEPDIQQLAVPSLANAQ